MNPTQVLDYKADLMARLTDPRIRRTWAGQIALDVNGMGMGKDVANSSGAAVIGALTHELPGTTCYHVSAEMTQLVVFAASQLDESDRIDYELLPTRSGIVRFEGGLPFTDVRGQKLVISWVAWTPVVVRNYLGPDRYGPPSESALIYLFNDHIDEPDCIFTKISEVIDGGSEAVLRLFGRWGFIGSENLAQGQRLGPAFLTPDTEKVAEVVADGDIPVAYTNSPRLMHAFWLLLSQTVTSVSDAQVERPVRRRAERKGIPPRVVVIGLRNRSTAGRAEGESLVEWSHRWLVRGHWHWFHCGAGHPLAQEVEVGKYMCRRWMAPYVKGPEGKPLVISEKVYSFHR